MSRSCAHILHVLVADDADLSRDIAACHVRAAGHLATCVADGKSAVAAAAAQQFDVVLMDVRMQPMGGLEATQRIRALPGPRGQVPVVAFTAHIGIEELAACQQAGMAGSLGKPFTRAELQAVLAQAGPQAPSPLPGDDSHNQGALPVLDPVMYHANTSLLATASVSTHLQNITSASAAMLAGLRAPSAPVPPDDNFIMSLHRLAGMAGLFGFQRLAETAFQFERAARCGTGDIPSLRGPLIIALELSVHAATQQKARVAALEGEFRVN